jgi:hypothetical protein
MARASESGPACKEWAGTLKVWIYPQKAVINLKKSRKHAEFADRNGPSW